MRPIADRKARTGSSKYNVVKRSTTKMASDNLLSARALRPNQQNLSIIGVLSIFATPTEGITMEDGAQRGFRSEFERLLQDAVNLWREFQKNAISIRPVNPLNSLRFNLRTYLESPESTSQLHNRRRVERAEP